MTDNNAAYHAKQMRKLAKKIEKELNAMYGTDMGFFLVASPFNQPKPIADYISNALREDGIQWLEETAERLKKNQTIPEPKHHA